MISPVQLIYKIELQSKLLAKSLNLPPKFGEEHLACAIYNFSSFTDLCSQLSRSNDDDIYSFILDHQNLKYLMINEIEDQFLIEELHEEVESMTTRLESLAIINMTKIQLISNLYELFGLDNESKYIVDAESLKLNWQPCFNSLQDQEAVLSSDFLINDIPFRLIATKIDFDNCSLDDLKKSLKTNLAQIEKSSFKNHEEKSQINEHLDWLVDSSQCLSNIYSLNSDECPNFFKINYQNFLIYGFPISPHLQINSEASCKNINIQIKNTEEKQIFILNIASEKLVFECIFLNKIEEGEKNHSPENQWVNDTVLAHVDACQFRIVFNKSYYLMIFRPFAHVDWLENTL